MFFLSGSTAPKNLEELTQSLTGPLREMLRLPADKAIVDARGAYPNLDQLALDLTGARIDVAHRPGRPHPENRPSPGITAQAVSIVGRPVQVDMGRISFEIIAENVRLDFDHDAGTGKLLLVPVSVGSGRASVEMAKGDLEAMILSQAKPLAAQQGATLTDVKLDVQRLGDRSLAVNVRAGAKKFMMSGVVHLAARVDVSDDLKARLSKLDCRGEGVAGTVAAGFIKPKLKEYEGREIALADFAFGGVHLRDVRITSVDPIRVEVRVE